MQIVKVIKTDPKVQSSIERKKQATRVPPSRIEGYETVAQYIQRKRDKGFFLAEGAHESMSLVAHKLYKKATPEYKEQYPLLLVRIKGEKKKKKAYAIPLLDSAFRKVLPRSRPYR